MRRSERTKSYELEIAKREFLKEQEPVKDYSWEDEYGYEFDDPKHPGYYDSVVDYYDVYGRDF